MSVLKNFIQIIARHPLTSIFDFSLGAATMIGGVALALAYDLESVWSDMTPREHKVTEEEVLALGVLLGICVAVFVWRRLLEDRQDRANRLQAERELSEQRSLALIDPLTGLPNRRHFLSALDAALSQNANGAVLLLDLNGFKAINDGFGHATGDEVLKAVASRFREFTRPQDVAARIGGDEFAVLASPVRSLEQAHEIGLRYVESLEHPIVVNGRLHSVGAALGIATWPEDGKMTVSLLQTADAAMYRAKRTGRSRNVGHRSMHFTIGRALGSGRRVFPLLLAREPHDWRSIGCTTA